MTIGLIIADGEDPGAGAACALLPVAASTLVEQAARVLRRAGGDRILILCADPGDALDAAVGRLRRAGIAATLVGDAATAAMGVDPHEPLLLLDAGTYVDDAALAALTGQGAPALLAVDDAPALGEWERIDAGARWAGALLVPAGIFAATARDLGDWALAPTLVRRALQAGGDLVRPPAGALVARTREAAAARELDRALAERAADVAGHALDLALAPLGRLLARPAARARLDPTSLGWAAAAGSLAAVPAIGLGRPAVGLALLLAGIVAAAVARRMALLSWAGAAIRRPEAMRAGALTLALPVLAARLALDTGTATAPATAAALAGFLWLAADGRRLSGAASDRPFWRATSDSMAVALGPVALVAGWTAALGGLALWGFATAAAVQRLPAGGPRQA